MPSTLNPSLTKLITLGRSSLFSHPEIHAIVRALAEWVPVYANGKRDEVSVAAIDLLAEFSEVALDRYPQS